MKTIYLEQRGNTGEVEHNKFFRLEDDGFKVTAFWGACGSKGQSKVLVESPDLNIRQRAWDKKFDEKTKRKISPYVVIQSSGVDCSWLCLSRTETGLANHECRPSSVGRRWGLEVETHSRLSVEEVARMMRERGLKVEVNSHRYFHSAGEVWDVKRDGSCGFEFASPILSSEAGIFDAKLVIEKIRQVCSTAVNRDCGIHVTVDVSDFNEQDMLRLIVMYLKCQDHFYAMCADYRAANHYCKKNPEVIGPVLNTTSVERAINFTCPDRYHGLNLMRTIEKKVVEFRMMESSVDMRKIGSWIRLCVGFVDQVKRLDVRFKSSMKIGKETFNKIIEGTWR
jgi:predicted DNA-binding WGR domain protein